jgi:hypothetical protein
MLDRRALATATLIGTVLQVGMVVSGHTNPAVKNLFAIGGMTISLVAGVAYVLLAPRTDDRSSLSLGGTIAGALCALIGIGVSWWLGDVPASLLALGTLSSAVIGTIGGGVAALARGRGATSATTP